MRNEGSVCGCTASSNKASIFHHQHVPVIFILWCWSPARLRNCIPSGSRSCVTSPAVGEDEQRKRRAASATKGIKGCKMLKITEKGRMRCSKMRQLSKGGLVFLRKKKSFKRNPNAYTRSLKNKSNRRLFKALSARNAICEPRRIGARNGTRIIFQT